MRTRHRQSSVRTPEKGKRGKEERKKGLGLRGSDHTLPTTEPQFGSSTPFLTRCIPHTHLREEVLQQRLHPGPASSSSLHHHLLLLLRPHVPHCLPGLLPLPGQLLLVPRLAVAERLPQPGRLGLEGLAPLLGGVQRADQPHLLVCLDEGGKGDGERLGDNQ